MKKSIFLLLLVLASSLFIFAQQQTPAPTPQFTKSELLVFSDVKAILKAVTGKDYSVYIVRNFTLSFVVPGTDSTKNKVSETGPGGQWSVHQRNMIEKYAVKGAFFTLENFLMIEPGKKGVADIAPVAFSIK